MGTIRRASLAARLRPWRVAVSATRQRIEVGAVRSVQVSAPAIILSGSESDPRAYEVRDMLQRSDVSFEWQNAPDFGAKIDGKVLTAPSTTDVARALGWATVPEHRDYDLVIYGGGPAGLSAAVYGASEGLHTLVVERAVVGGQAGSSSRIENFVGFPNGIAGWDFAERTREQACRLGAEIVRLRAATSSRVERGELVTLLDTSIEVHGRASIIATGVDYTRLPLRNIGNFLNKGVFYGAGASEAPFVAGEPVYIVGGGNSAGQAALDFAKKAADVYMLVRGDGLAQTMSMYLIDEIYNTPNIHIINHTEVVGLDGDPECLTRVQLRIGNINVWRETRRLFVCIGGRPQTGWLSSRVTRDSAGYILTGVDVTPPTLPFQTKVAGVFAAGDVRHASMKRVASAVGDGASAVSSVHQYLTTVH